LSFSSHASGGPHKEDFEEREGQPEIHKISDMILWTLKTFGYSAILSSGPWVISMIIILGIGLFFDCIYLRKAKICNRNQKIKNYKSHSKIQNIWILVPF